MCYNIVLFSCLIVCFINVESEEGVFTPFKNNWTEKLFVPIFTSTGVRRASLNLTHEIKI